MITLEYILTFDSGQQVFGESTFSQVFSDKDQAIVYFKTLSACESRHLLRKSEGRDPELAFKAHSCQRAINPICR